MTRLDGGSAPHRGRRLDPGAGLKKRSQKVVTGCERWRWPFSQALAMAFRSMRFQEVGKSERIVTIVVLLVASAEIILTRPRRREDDLSRPAEPVQSPPHDGRWEA